MQEIKEIMARAILRFCSVRKKIKFTNHNNKHVLFKRENIQNPIDNC